MTRAFEEAIAERLAKGNLNADERGFLKRWANALDDDVWRRNAWADWTVKDALEQLRIAKGGKAAVDSHNKKNEGGARRTIGPC